MSGGRVYLVGAGPGDPGLITVLGQELLSRADVVVYDHLVSPRVLELTPPAAERICVGKQPGRRGPGQQQINSLLVERARRGLMVVRLKGGDPFLFGRGGEEAIALTEAGVPFEVVPGVTAGLAAAAYAGVAVTMRGISSGVCLVTGHEASDKAESALDWQALARWPGTLVFYMSVSRLSSICQDLTLSGLSAETPALAIQWGTTVRQRVVEAPLGRLAQAARRARLEPPAVIVIGQVVRLREQLKWFERRPLSGRRIVVTRPRSSSGVLTARLEALAAEVIEVPVIRIESPQDPRPLQEALAEIASFEWVILTSGNAVEAVFRTLSEMGLDGRALAGRKVCAIGSATAARLKEFGLRADAQPSRFSTEGILSMFRSSGGLAGARVLLPRSDLAGGALAVGLAALGARVHEVVAYRVAFHDCDVSEVCRLLVRNELHWLTFTSGSTVRGFLRLVGHEALRSAGARIASIGPSTSAALAEFGLVPAVEAQPHTAAALADAIVRCEGEAPR